jgi:hypothetical protein
VPGVASVDFLDLPRIAIYEQSVEPLEELPCISCPGRRAENPIVEVVEIPNQTQTTSRAFNYKSCSAMHTSQVGCQVGGRDRVYCDPEIRKPEWVEHSSGRLVVVCRVPRFEEVVQLKSMCMLEPLQSSGTTPKSDPGIRRQTSALPAAAKPFAELVEAQRVVRVPVS